MTRTARRPIRPSRRLAALEGYAFDEVKKRVAALRAHRASSPSTSASAIRPSPRRGLVRERLKTAVDERATSGYPSYQGDPCVSAPRARRGCSAASASTLDPEREICATIGSKEAVFHAHEGLLDPGDLILVPSPGYPPYKRGALFAEARPWFYPLRRETGYLPDLDAIPADVADRARAIWVCYPNSPTGAVADRAFYERLVEKADRHGWVVLSDEAYSEIYFGDEPPTSLIQVRKEGSLVFFSMSKRSAMTGWRIGWVAGDEELVAAFRKVKTNVDSGTPTFIQDAAVAALEDEAHVVEFRARLPGEARHPAGRLRRRRPAGLHARRLPLHLAAGARGHERRRLRGAPARARRSRSSARPASGSPTSSPTARTPARATCASRSCPRSRTRSAPPTASPA